MRDLFSVEAVHDGARVQTPLVPVAAVGSPSPATSALMLQSVVVVGAACNDDEEAEEEEEDVVVGPTILLILVSEQSLIAITTPLVHSLAPLIVMG